FRHRSIFFSCQVLDVLETVGCHQDGKVGFFALIKYKELIRVKMAFVLNFNLKHGNEMVVIFRSEERKHIFAWPIYLECDQRYDGMGKSTKHNFTNLFLDTAVNKPIFISDSSSL
ncbi:hypothetical protein EJB05_09594, partial [Eragrostis curvula]